MAEQLAIVTGASRGIGLETARQLGRLGYRLIAAAKDRGRIDSAAALLRHEGCDVRAKVLDMASKRSIGAFGTWARGLGPIDVLVNCAGIMPESGQGGVLDAADDEVAATINVNLIGPWRLCRALAPYLAPNARVVNVSSGMGGLQEMGAGYFGYRASKAGINVLTRTLARDLAARGIMVNSVCPGWVRTDMGGTGAPRSVEQGASGVVWAATLPPGGPTNGFFRDGKPIPW